MQVLVVNECSIAQTVVTVMATSGHVPVPSVRCSAQPIGNGFIQPCRRYAVHPRMSTPAGRNNFVTLRIKQVSIISCYYFLHTVPGLTWID